ncbi:MAG: NOP5/NOP56 family protein [Candidatus Hodarchaeota archaeon]
MQLLLTSFGIIILKEPKSPPIIIQSFGKDAKQCAEYLNDIQTESKRKEQLGRELKEFLLKQTPGNIVTNHPILYYLVKQHLSDSINIDLDTLILPRLKEKLFISLKAHNLIHPNPEEFEREIAYHLARSQIKAVAKARDVFISQAIHALDDFNATLNLIANRLFEWYGLHFPELSSLTRDNVQYMQLIKEIGNQQNFTKKRLSYLSDTRSERILEAKNGSLGVEMPEYDLEPVRKLAELGLQTNRSKEFLEKYIEEAMLQTAPNLSSLISPLVGARLIALAGSLENLAKKPSSTVQVLGAEKALFRALKTKTAPPKHGILFQSPLVHQAVPHQRGRIARALAAKISMAARIDFFSGEFLADELKVSLDQRIKVIQEQYSSPPPPKPATIAPPKKKERETKKTDRPHKKRRPRQKSQKSRRSHQDSASKKSQQKGSGKSRPDKKKRKN